MAIYGPYTHSVQPAGFYRYRRWYRQDKPYKTRLPFTLTQKQILADFNSPPRSASGKAVMNENDRKQAIAYAYDKFKAELGDNAQIGAGIAEWRSTAGSINSNCSQLFQLAKAVAKRSPKDIQRALRDIGAPKIPGTNSVKKRLTGSMADRWLEFSFGWKPLVDDIYNGISVLCSPLPSATVRGRRTVRAGRRRSGVSWTSTGFLYTSGTVKCQMMAEVSVTNPNLYVNNQLGLINPVSIAWELVPWSFVIDWFTNLGQVLGTLSDFAGCTLNNAATTVLGVTTSEYFFGFVQDRLDDYYLCKTVEVVRTQGITGPSLLIRPFNGFSVTRGANALSLALQQLIRQ